MRAPFLFILATTVATVNCGRPSSSIQDPSESQDSPVEASSQTSAIPTTGGRAVSADGLFSVIIAPLTFEELVTIEIERLQEPAAEGDGRAQRGGRRGEGGGGRCGCGCVYYYCHLNRNILRQPYRGGRRRNDRRGASTVARSLVCWHHYALQRPGRPA